MNKISLILLSLTLPILAGQAYKVFYDVDDYGYSRYFVVNYTNEDMLCEVFGSRGYYNEFWVDPNSRSRKYYTPGEKIKVRCG